MSLQEGKKLEDERVEIKKQEASRPEEKKDENKAEKESSPPPPPPPEIVLKVYMHCEGCARKVRRCLQGFAGVEDVMTDCKSGEVVVKGEKADPLKVLERVQKKSHRKVELLSPIPKPPAEEDNKKTDPADQEQQQPAKPEDRKEDQSQPQVIIVVLKVYMHCEACAQEIKKRILRMNGVESAEPDLKTSQVTVKGVFEAAKLVEYVLKKTGKHAAILKQDPEKKEEEKKPEEGGKDKKEDGGAGEEGGRVKEKEGGDGGGGDAKPAAEATATSESGAGTEETRMVEVKRNEYYHYQQRYAMEMYDYPPQIFSDENPNACSIM